MFLPRTQHLFFFGKETLQTQKKLGDKDKDVVVMYGKMLIVKAVYAGSKALGPIVRGGPKPHWS